MNEKLPDEERLWEEALDLIIRLHDDPENPVANELISIWRARSPSHEAVWQEAAEIYGMTGQLLLDRKRLAQGHEQKLSRRRLLVAGTVGLGGAVAASISGPGLMLQAEADFLTAKAEITRIPLEDGSTATLGPESAIKLDFTEGARRIELLSGMAFFEVAPNEARPFSVSSGQLTAIALGTAFDVAAESGYITVAVNHGVIEVRAPESPLAQGERLGAGRWIALDRVQQAVHRGVRDPAQIAAWRDNLLVVDREPISAVVARIGRWQPGSVIIADPDLGERQVSGIFDLSQPLHALEAVVHPYAGRVRQLSPWITVLSKI